MAEILGLKQWVEDNLKSPEAIQAICSSHVVYRMVKEGGPSTTLIGIDCEIVDHMKRFYKDCDFEELCLLYFDNYDTTTRMTAAKLNQYSICSSNKLIALGMLLREGWGVGGTRDTGTSKNQNHEAETNSNIEG